MYIVKIGKNYSTGENITSNIFDAITCNEHEAEFLQEIQGGNIIEVEYCGGVFCQPCDAFIKPSSKYLMCDECMGDIKDEFKKDYLRKI